jgi:toxin CcdB
MARLDVYRNGADGYLLDVQADIVYGLNTRLTVPLMPSDCPNSGQTAQSDIQN